MTQILCSCFYRKLITVCLGININKTFLLSTNGMVVHLLFYFYFSLAFVCCIMYGILFIWTFDAIFILAYLSRTQKLKCLYIYIIYCVLCELTSTEKNGFIHIEAWEVSVRNFASSVNCLLNFSVCLYQKLTESNYDNINK